MSNKQNDIWYENLQELEEERKYSADYPLGGSIEPYDIQREKELMAEEYALEDWKAAVKANPYKGNK